MEKLREENCVIQSSIPPLNVKIEKKKDSDPTPLFDKCNQFHCFFGGLPL